AFVDEGFTGFSRVVQPKVFYVCMTRYDATIPAEVAFDKTSKMKNTAGDYLSGLGLKQFRCAETEKYAHVTFFFNDYSEQPFKGEDRQIVPSPKVKTYDLKPEMSAYPLTDILLERLSSGKYDFVVLNYANPDMVGHTGVIKAAVKAAEVVDECVGKVLKKIEELGGSAIVTADHGNLEQMYNPQFDCMLTSHTTYPVPLYVVDDQYGQSELRQDGRLADVLPTAFHLMGLKIPKEMTGTSLIVE
ncbi:MAG: alkaline phosphatase family protein, partial [Planctomycetes bacterium]|nr:alkaline phosphatase family protein [Planctomycetota bacterium]